MYYVKGNKYLDIADDGYLSYLKHFKTNICNKGKEIPPNNYSAMSKLFNNSSDNNELFPGTGINSLDKSISGSLKPGLYIIGANPGLGKTSLMIHIMINMALQGQNTIFYNLEMSSKQTLARVLANCSFRSDSNKKFNINDIFDYKYLKSEDKDEFKTQFDSYLNNVNKYIDILSNSDSFYSLTEETTLVTCIYIESIERAIKNAIDMGFKPVIIIDSLQMLKIKWGADDEDDQKMLFEDKRLITDRIINRLKRISGYYGVPILLISALSRSNYTKDDADIEETQINMSIFKETGQIEYQGDFLAVLTKGKKIVKFGESDSQIINLNILKNRFGSVNNVALKLQFNPSYCFFKESEESTDE